MNCDLSSRELAVATPDLNQIQRARNLGVL